MPAPASATEFLDLVSRSQLLPEPKLDEVTSVIFRETTTIGFRYLPMGRIELARRIETAKTPHGPVRMKVSVYNGEVVQATPEYEDCRRAALAAGVPLKDVQRRAAAAYAPPRGSPERLAAWARAPVTPAKTRRRARPGTKRRRR